MGQEISLWTVAHKSRLAFSSPKEMWETALKYFEWCDCNPLYKTEQLKKPGNQIVIVEGVAVHPETLVEMPLKRPYTKEGFCLFAGVSSNYLRRIENGSGEGATVSASEDNKAWIEAANKISKAIWNQQYEGAAAGQLQPMIVARGIGLVDKIETKIEERTVKEVFKIGGQEFEL